MSDLTRRYPKGIDVYRVRARWGTRRGVMVRVPEHWWQRTWQAEWDGCQRAVRAYTRNGALVKATRTAGLVGEGGDA